VTFIYPPINEVRCVLALRFKPWVEVVINEPTLNGTSAKGLGTSRAKIGAFAGGIGFGTFGLEKPIESS
jgi:hypothetical protein